MDLYSIRLIVPIMLLAFQTQDRCSGYSYFFYIGARFLKLPHRWEQLLVTDFNQNVGEFRFFSEDPLLAVNFFSPVCRKFSNPFCIFPLVGSSAIFSLERTNPILEISFFLYASRAACTSSMILFSLVRDPSLIISNRYFESVSNRTGTGLIVDCSNWDRIARASSNESANTTTSADRTDLVTLRDL